MSSRAKRLRGVAIGAGYFSHYQYEAWKRIPEVDVCALQERANERAEAAREAFGIAIFGLTSKRAQPGLARDRPWHQVIVLVATTVHSENKTPPASNGSRHGTLRARDPVGAVLRLGPVSRPRSPT